MWSHPWVCVKLIFTLHLVEVNFSYSLYGCSEISNLGKWCGDCRKRGLSHTNIRFHRSLNILNLADNEIVAISGNEFQDMGQIYLQEIILRNNQLQSIDRLAFNGLEKLEIVDLSYNRIFELPTNLFSHHYQLWHLNLSFNELRDDFTLAAPGLEILDLAECRFKSVPVLCLKSLPKLRVFNISYNQIRSISIDEFRHPQLMQIDIEGNRYPCDHEESQVMNWLKQNQIAVTSRCQWELLQQNGEHEVAMENKSAAISFIENMELEEISSTHRTTPSDSEILLQRILLISNVAISAIVLTILVCVMRYVRGLESRREVQIQAEVAYPDESLAPPPPYRAIYRH